MPPMDDGRVVARMLAVQITVGTARRLFPGVSRSALYAAAPHDGHARRLSLGAAFHIARQQFEAVAVEVRTAAADANRAGALADRRAAIAIPALDYLAAAIATESAALLTSLHRCHASASSVRSIERVAAVNCRHAGRVRVRLLRSIQEVEDYGQSS